MADIAGTVEKAAPLLGLAGPEGMALAALLPALINLTKAGVQGAKANKIAKDNTRPQYQIPQALIDATNNAKYQAGQTKMPGYDLMQQQLNQNNAGALANLKDVSSNGAGLGSNIASIYRGSTDAQNQLGIANAQNWNNNQQMLRGQLGQLANAQNFQWDYNQNQPYQNRAAASSALREGAFRNLSAAGQDIGAAGAGYANLMGQNPNADVPGYNWNMTGGVQNKQPLMNMTGALSTPNVVNPTSQTIDTQGINNLMKYSNNNPNKWFENYSLTH